MLNANPQDRAKLEAQLSAIIMKARADHHAVVLTPEEEQQFAKKLRFIQVDHSDFYTSCTFTSLRKTKFAEEVQDALCGLDFCRKHGSWLYAEFDMGTWLLIFIGDSNSTAKDLSNLEDAAELVVVDMVKLTSEKSKSTSKREWYIDVDGKIREFKEGSGTRRTGPGQVSIEETFGVYMTDLFDTKEEAQEEIDQTGW